MEHLDSHSLKLLAFSDGDEISVQMQGYIIGLHDNKESEKQAAQVLHGFEDDDHQVYNERL